MNQKIFKMINPLVEEFNLQKSLQILMIEGLLSDYVNNENGYCSTYVSENEERFIRWAAKKVWDEYHDAAYPWYGQLDEEFCNNHVANRGGRQQDRSGYIYLISSDFGYKIGRTKNPKQRHKIFNVKLPFKTEIIYLIHVEDYYDAEKKAHIHFKEKRMNGEWFNLSEKEVNEFANTINKITNG